MNGDCGRMFHGSALFIVGKTGKIDIFVSDKMKGK